MKPITFPGVNRNLVGPEGSGIMDLPAWTNGNQVISCWRMTWRERLIALLTGNVWLSVFSGRTQPPVKLTVTDPQIPVDQGDINSIVKAALKRLRKSAHLLALALLLFGCSQETKQLSPYYQIRGGVLYGWDGHDWYARRNESVDGGQDHGSQMGQPECWIKVGGNRNQCYIRSGSPLEAFGQFDYNVPPHFFPY